MIEVHFLFLSNHVTSSSKFLPKPTSPKDSLFDFLSNKLCKMALPEPEIENVWLPGSDEESEDEFEPWIESLWYTVYHIRQNDCQQNDQDHPENEPEVGIEPEIEPEVAAEVFFWIYYDTFHLEHYHGVWALIICYFINMGIPYAAYESYLGSNPGPIIFVPFSLGQFLGSKILQVRKWKEYVLGSFLILYNLIFSRVIHALRS